MKVLVVHNITGATKTAVLQAPHVSRQMIDGGIHVILADSAGGRTVGEAMFGAGGIVALTGTAVEQYGPIETGGSDG